MEGSAGARQGTIAALWTRPPSKRASSPSTDQKMLPYAWDPTSPQWRSEGTQPPANDGVSARRTPPRSTSVHV
ncbi:hypothetical protein ACKKBG_A33610 [Auxenochlorella protothecoides x Auxenochlorella symbiontica]